MWPRMVRWTCPCRAGQVPRRHCSRTTKPVPSSRHEGPLFVDRWLTPSEMFLRLRPLLTYSARLPIVPVLMCSFFSPLVSRRNIMLVVNHTISIPTIVDGRWIRTLRLVHCDIVAIFCTVVVCPPPTQKRQQKCLWIRQGKYLTFPDSSRRFFSHGIFASREGLQFEN